MVDQELVVPSCDTAELLQLAKEAFDRIAFLVEGPVVRPSLLSVRCGRDERFCSGVADGLVQVVGVASFVGDHDFRLEASDQLVAAGGIVALTWPEQQTHRVAERVRGRVNLGAQAAAGAAQSLSIRPPFAMRAPAACRCARTTEHFRVARKSHRAGVSPAQGPAAPGCGTHSGEPVSSHRPPARALQPRRVPQPPARCRVCVRLEAVMNRAASASCATA